MESILITREYPELASSIGSSGVVDVNHERHHYSEH